MEDLWAQITPALVTLFGVLLTWIINRAAASFELATGVRVEQNARDALHSAIKSGVEAALRDGPQAGFDEIRAHAIYHAQQSVPDAIETLVPGDGVLDRIALRYYREAMDRIGVPVPVKINIPERGTI